MPAVRNSSRVSIASTSVSTAPNAKSTAVARMERAGAFAV